MTRFSLRDEVWLTLVMTAVLAVITVGSYSAGYILLSEERVIGATKLRVFPNEFLARMYYPASLAERSLTRQKILLGSH